MPYNFTTIEKKWQQYWLANKSFRALEPSEAGKMPKAYVLDMFPYPSGAGLHVGHPEGYTATDIVSRYLRMKGFNVLHPMGWDAFGLPAEQYAIKTNTHPRITTEQNIANFRRQIQMLGLSYDWDREVDTTDPGYYRWTQWIFLQLFNSYFDPIDRKARPIGHLMNELVNENLVIAPDGSLHINPAQEGTEAVMGEVRTERLWRELSAEDRRGVIDGLRLAYTAEVPVNWCPGLGTVLANEEVIDGKSEVGGFPVEKRPMRQWMLRITAYADRLLEDLEKLDWPESLKEMQRNWIGRSVGAEVDFEVVGERHEVAEAQRHEGTEARSEEEEGVVITVFTTRPDTLYGATYMVLAPEHPMVDRITPEVHRETVEAYRIMVAGKSERERMAETKEKTGVFIGAFAINPVNDERIPIYIADYVLMGYGTGAIMAVPGHDERDFEFAKKFDLPIRAVVRPGDEWLQARAERLIKAHGGGHVHQTTINGGRVKEEYFEIDAKEAASNASVETLQIMYMDSAESAGEAFVGEGIAINSPMIDGLPTAEAKENIISLLAAEGVAYRTVKYKLRDWLFSRQRYWGEPFPIVLDEVGNPYAVSEEELPITLPEMEDFKPTGTPEPPLSKAKEWLRVESDGQVFMRETNTMPQWAGSCWYYLRYIDPKNTKRFVDPEKEKYWMPIDLYVGGVEHAVLHLLYSRFWHKVLFDLGHVSTAEPFARLVNQGLILGEMEYHVFVDEAGRAVSVSDLRDLDEEATEQGVRMFGVHRQSGAKLYGKRVSEEEVEKAGEGYRLKSDRSIRVDARSFKMSKSRGNVVNPDEIVKDYGADCFRLYEMYLGPLEAQKPWNTRDIVGMARFLNAVWRNLVGEDGEATEGMQNAEGRMQKAELNTQHPALSTQHSALSPRHSAPSTQHSSRVSSDPVPEDLDRVMHRTIKKVGEDIEGLRFNTAIAELIKLNNEMGRLPAVPRKLAENFVLMLAPFAPHLAEEIWQRLGHGDSLARAGWPVYEPAKLVEAMMELPVQVNGKLRDRICVPADATEEQILNVAMSAEKAVPWLAGKEIVKRMYVLKKMVSFVVK